MNVTHATVSNQCRTSPCVENWTRLQFEVLVLYGFNYSHLTCKCSKIENSVGSVIKVENTEQKYKMYFHTKLTLLSYFRLFSPALGFPILFEDGSIYNCIPCLIDSEGFSLEFEFQLSHWTSLFTVLHCAVVKC